MPSLRRTISSPAVRSSPYPPTSASSHIVARPQGSRRHSGSDTATRRVLADIEWWRVADGQRDTDSDGGMEDPAQDDHDGIGRLLSADDTLPHPTILSVDSHVERPFSPLDLPSSYWSGSPELPLSPTMHLATFATAPQTPPRRRHGLESSSSSLESTPEVSQGLECVRIGIEYLDLGYQPGVSRHPAICRGHAETHPSPLLSARARLFEEYPVSTDERHYADFAVSPLSSISLGLLN